jgi:hypothetical protein
MVLQYPIRLPPTALASADPIQLRRDAAERVEASRLAIANPQPTITDAAAVVTFGARAIGLARSTQPLPREDISVGLADPNEVSARLSGVDPQDTDAVLARSIGPNVANPALLNALDGTAEEALLRAPGELDQESGLFRDPASPLESGFFLSPDAAVDAALLRPLESGALESAFPRPLGQNELRESGFFRSPNARAESPLTALEGSALESAFPKAPTLNENAESIFFRPLTENDVFENGPLARNGTRTNDIFENGPLENGILAQDAAFESSALRQNDALTNNLLDDDALDDSALQNNVFERNGLQNGTLGSGTLLGSDALRSAPSLLDRTPLDATEEAARATQRNAETLFTGAPLVQNRPSLFPNAVRSLLEPVVPAAAVQAARALGLNPVESELPQNPAENTESTLFRDPLAPNSDSPFDRSPAAFFETAGERGPVANNAEARLFRSPTENAPNGDLGNVTARDRAETLSAEERRQLQAMEREDRSVRSDELTQRAAAGGYADGTRVRYQVGPDGRRYAVDSQVTFDTTPVPGDPGATLRKMEVVSRAATASTNPSASDRSAAAEAQQLIRQARAQLAAERYNETIDRFGRQ